MKPIDKKRPIGRFVRAGAAGLVLLAVGACSAFRPSTTPPPAFYSLDNAQNGSAARTGLPCSTLTLIVNPSHAAAGFDSQRMIYLREPHKLEYFAHSEWVDPPARMLGPLLVSAIENTGAFHAVALTPGAATGDLRLDTELIRLQHEFQTHPSRVRFTLRAYLVQERTRRVLAKQEFDGYANAASEDPYGGVMAANHALQLVLQDLSSFVAKAACKLQKPQ